jgi:hypothetical protein
LDELAVEDQHQQAVLSASDVAIRARLGVPLELRSPTDLLFPSRRVRVQFDRGSHQSGRVRAYVMCSYHKGSGCTKYVCVHSFASASASSSLTSPEVVVAWLCAWDGAGSHVRWPRRPRDRNSRSRSVCGGKSGPTQALKKMMI